MSNRLGFSLAPLALTSSMLLQACAAPQPPPTEAPPTATPASTATAAPTQTRRPTPTSPPSPTPDPCMRWDQVTADMQGETVCLKGVVSELTQSRQVGSRYQFGDQPNGLFLYSKFWELVNSRTGKTLGPGTCVVVIGTIQVQAGIPFINIDELAGKVSGQTIQGLYSYDDTTPCE
jgi:hypothetical protein